MLIKNIKFIFRINIKYKNNIMNKINFWLEHSLSKKILKLPISVKYGLINSWWYRILSEFIWGVLFFLLCCIIKYRLVVSCSNNTIISCTQLIHSYKVIIFFKMFRLNCVGAALNIWLFRLWTRNAHSMKLIKDY